MVRRARIGLAVAVTVSALVACGPRASGQTPQTPASPLPTSLRGTTWELVEFRSSDDGIGVQTIAPELYTMTLLDDGTVSMRLDCNRATGTWSATSLNADGGSFGFGPLAMTRVMCQAGSLDAQIVRHSEFVSAFILRDGILYLNLLADGGTYVWERRRQQ